MDFWTRCFLPLTVHDRMDAWGPIAFIYAYRTFEFHAITWRA